MTFYEFELPDNIKKLGFARTYRDGKTLVVNHVKKGKTVTIFSRFVDGDLQTTIHHLEGALVKYNKTNKNYFADSDIQKFVVLFAELKLGIDEQQRELDRLKVVRESG